MSFVPVILCGGSGSRLWPRSRVEMPKPFVVLPGREQSLIADTYQRLLSGEKARMPDAIITVTAEKYAFLCEKSYEESGLSVPHIIIKEPLGRNTASAIAVAATVAERRLGDDVILAVLPADHLIADTNAFQSAMALAIEAAILGRMALLGIPPTYPATAYGYIECEETSTADIFPVRRFVEKPDLPTATTFFQRPDFFWNAGIFCFAAKTVLAQLAAFAPDIASHLPALLAGVQPNSQSISLPSATYRLLPSISFDYAVMEKTDIATVIRAAHLRWSDIGSWSALAETLAVDTQGNRLVGDVRLSDCVNCFVAGEQRLIIGMGLDNIQIIDSEDALLVTTAAQSEKVRAVAEALLADNRQEAIVPKTVQRPWGTYTVLSEGQGYKVKRIDVLPGAQLSLQSHQHRSEHWTTVAGTMSIVIDERHFDMAVNQSCYIPQSAKHRMINKTPMMAVIIEVQIGDYLGEDDITRYEDIYGRA